MHNIFITIQTFGPIMFKLVIQNFVGSCSKINIGNLYFQGAFKKPFSNSHTAYTRTEDQGRLQSEGTALDAANRRKRQILG